jgi:hypothetical protein
VAQIADAMRLALTQPALVAALRAKGLARAAQFTWERTARETIAVYERVLGTDDDRRRTVVGNRRSCGIIKPERL